MDMCIPGSPCSPEDFSAEQRPQTSSVQPEQLSQDLALPLAPALLLQVPYNLPGQVPSLGKYPHGPRDGDGATKTGDTEKVFLLTRQGRLFSPDCLGLYRISRGVPENEKTRRKGMKSSLFADSMIAKKIPENLQETNKQWLQILGQYAKINPVYICCLRTVGN